MGPPMQRSLQDQLPSSLITSREVTVSSTLRCEHPPMDHSHPHTHDATHASIFDRVGAFLGIACAIHCLAVPLLLGVLPTLGLGFLAEHGFDLIIIISALAFAAMAAYSGFKVHRDRRILWGFALAAALMLGGHELEHMDTLWGRVPAILGGLTLAAVHFFNLRLARRCAC